MRLALALLALIWLDWPMQPAGAAAAIAVAPGFGRITGPAPPALLAVSDAAADDDAARSDFELAAKIGSRRAYLAFLDAHPAGRYADQARDALRALGPPPEDRRPPQSAPNWGDGIFIERLMRKTH